MAAEVLGIAYSGFAIAGAGSGLGKTAITIKRLRDAVQDAPDQMQWLSDQLCVLQPLVADLETLLLNSPVPNTGSTTSVSCVQLYNKAMQNLSHLADDLKADLTASHWSKRVKAKVKIAMKQDRIRMYQERLNTTVQVLMLCYQKYTASLMLSQDLTSVEPVAQRQSGNRGVQAQNNIIHSHGCIESSKNGTFWDTTAQLGWLSPGYFARFRYKTKTIASETGSYDVSHLQLQLPFWLSSTMWDVSIRRACFGWKAALRPITTREFDRKFCDIIEAGSSFELFAVMSEQGWSIHDRNSVGETVLHLAIQFRNYNTAIALIRAGARLDEDNWLGLTPLSELCLQRDGRTHRLKFFQELSGLGLLEDFAELPIVSSSITAVESEIYCSHTALQWAMWRDVAVFDLVVAISPNDAPKLWQDQIPWDCVEPSTFPELLQRSNFNNSEEFRMSSMNASPYHIQSFTRHYFRRLGTHITVIDPVCIKKWRNLCRMILRYVPLAGLSMKAAESDTTPLLEGLRFHYYLNDSTKTLRRLKRQILKFWLEDLRAIGKDLEAYGRSEVSMLASQSCRTTDIDGNTIYFPPCIHSLEYGPNPEDWEVHWDYCKPEYAREFWNYIEMEQPRMPGSWIEGPDHRLTAGSIAIEDLLAVMESDCWDIWPKHQRKR